MIYSYRKMVIMVLIKRKKKTEGSKTRKDGIRKLNNFWHVL
jgi:hypothetical protein